MFQCLYRALSPIALRRLAGVLLLVWIVPVQAHTVQLLGASAASDEFVQALRDGLGDTYQVVTSAAAEPEFVVVLHEGALAQARAMGKPSLLLLSTPGVTPLQPEETAVYWAPPLGEQLRLAARILPGLRRVGLLVSAQALARAEALRQPVPPRVELVIRTSEPATLARQVADLASSADVFVAPVDPLLYSRDNLKPVLMAAYRQNRVFIGPSLAWVRAGALASLHASPDTLATDVTAAIQSYRETGDWPAPALASRFDVITNPQVARALGLRLPDAAALTRAMQSDKGGTWP